MQRKYALIVLAIVIGGALLYMLSAWQKPSDTQQALDESTEEEDVLSVSGTVVPARQARLGFTKPGRIKRISVQVGDGVRAGQVIVELDASDLQADVEAAQEAVNVAKAQLAQIGGTTETDREAAAAAVEGARERLVQAEASTTAQEKMAEAKLEAAKAKLDQLLAGATQEDIRAAELQLEQARNTLWATQIERDGIKGNRANPEFLGQAADAKVAAAETAVKIAEANLLKLKTGPSAEEVRIARAAVTQAEAELAALRQTKEATLAAAASNFRSAEARLAQISQDVTPRRTPTATQPEIEAARARVRQAEGMLRRALAELEQARLAAPFDGVVAAISANEGEVVTPGNPVLIIGDITSLRVETTDLRETSVAKVHPNQVVQITFDALPERAYKGRITRIAPMATTGAGGTNYTAIIELDEHEPALRWGMTANVVIDSK